MAEPPPGMVSLVGSGRTRASSSRLIEAFPDNEIVSVNLVLRLPLGAPPLPDLSYRGNLASSRRSFLTREEYAETYSATAADLKTVSDFVTGHGLEITETNAATRNVSVKGTARQFNTAFGIELNRYESPLPPRRVCPHLSSHPGDGDGDGEAPATHIHRGFDGLVNLPAALSGVVIAVIGLDNRSRGGPCGDGNPPGADAITVSQALSLYNFPQTEAEGEIIGIIAFGGYDPSDLQQYFGANNVPAITDVPLEVDGAVYSNPGTGIGYEITADVCIAGAAAPGAAINTYWTVASELGWQTFLNRVLRPPIGAIEQPPTVVSLSFVISFADDPTYEDPVTGSEFGSSSDPASIPGALSAIFQALASIGVNVFAATDDFGADAELQGNTSSSQPHVLYPPSDPSLIACGGTMVGQQNGSPTLSSEYIWSDLYQANLLWSGATGGGASHNFPNPSYQAQAGITTVVDSNGTSYNNRFIPDVSGMVLFKTFHQNTTPFPDFLGTSCIAPFYAGLAARIQSAFGFSPVSVAKVRLD
ncbi:protease propeptide/inhibitor [Hyaloscypha variabilis F]|uniref:tripeptidyl-peptidase II n=1 Tax=Hyaloscypha variabilis (strain UAMH 11265 / GT02V1 / F) TaxID=1149755 RepID=A0A2J6QVB8_HYAVF|nr:protease propeptide/inhibitor [Hyaloscypha variabilis F]